MSNRTDLDAMIANLRLVKHGLPVARLKALAHDAADRLEQQAATIAKLRAACEAVAEECNFPEAHMRAMYTRAEIRAVNMCRDAAFYPTAAECEAAERKEQGR
jgi:hypothetical protein